MSSEDNIVRGRIRRWIATHGSSIQQKTPAPATAGLKKGGELPLPSPSDKWREKEGGNDSGSGIK